MEPADSVGIRAAGGHANAGSLAWRGGAEFACTIMGVILGTLCAVFGDRTGAFGAPAGLADTACAAGRAGASTIDRRVAVFCH